MLVKITGEVVGRPGSYPASAVIWLLLLRCWVPLGASVSLFAHKGLPQWSPGSPA